MACVFIYGVQGRYVESSVTIVSVKEELITISTCAQQWETINSKFF